MQKILLIGGDRTCIDKLKKFDFVRFSDFQYLNLHLENNLSENCVDELMALINSSKVAIRAKLKFVYKLSKHFFQSNSFSIQLRTIIFGNYRIRSIETLIYFLRHIVKNKSLTCIFFSFLGFLKISESLIDRLLAFNLPEIRILNCIIERNRPHAFVLLTSGYDHISFLLNYIEKQNAMKIIYLINNWDNPSSKGFINNRADHVALWNSQQADHIYSISGFDKKLMTVVGSHTADSAYLKYGDLHVSSKVKSNNSRQLLYIGQQSKYDEITDIINISNLLKNESCKYTKLVYRPHPFSAHKLKQTTSKLINQDGFEVNLNSDLDLTEYAGIIALPTTFILEVILSKVPAILYLPKNNIFRKNPHSMWQYKHFDTLRNNNPMIMAENFNTLKNFIINGLPPQNNINATDFFDLFPKLNLDYPSRINILLKTIMQT